MFLNLSIQLSLKLYIINKIYIKLLFQWKHLLMIDWSQDDFCFFKWNYMFLFNQNYIHFETNSLTIILIFVDHSRLFIII